ncbi:hypothetical protein LR48_Vigan08g129000 [Vigna angularis]|uniref:Uncharacterized protein n=1 Tax=Phaseolus angularis TaxID=3914 RepID=A0A0L9V658_PHAAN|nr:hypothetical protein LR48_Vigan08g129000 [Vigna angularis]
MCKIMRECGFPKRTPPMNSTFVGTRFDAFETQFGNMDMAMGTRFDALESRVRNIEEQLQHLRSDFDNEPGS